MRNNIGRVSKHVSMKTSDSKEHELTKNDRLSGGTLTATIGKLSSYVAESTKKRTSWGNGTK